MLGEGRLTGARLDSSPRWQRSITRAQRGATDFKWQGWSNWDKNQNPKKIPWASKRNKKKIPRPKFNPQKIPRRISKPYKFPESIPTKNKNISFEYPKKSLIKSSYPEKYLPKFSYPKKSLHHPCHLISDVPRSPLPPNPRGNRSHGKWTNYLTEAYDARVGTSSLFSLALQCYFIYFNCPCRDFAQKAKFRGGTLVTRAYIKESTYSWNIQSDR